MMAVVSIALILDSRADLELFRTTSMPLKLWLLMTPKCLMKRIQLQLRPQMLADVDDLVT